MKFQQSIGWGSLLLTAVGGIVGSGWLFGPLYAAQLAGPAAIIAWILGAALMTVLGFSFAELSANKPMPGSMVQFAQLSHGPLMSFTTGWMVWLASVVVAPIETLALIQYATNFFPGLMHKVSNTYTLTFIGFIVAAFLMMAMVVINHYSVKLFSRITNLMVLIKLIVPLITAITLFSYHFHATNLHQFGGFAPYGIHGVLSALTLGGIVFSFIGSSPAIQLAAEAKNPKFALPVAIIGSVILAVILYVLLQLAFVGSLDANHLQNGWAKISFTGETGPFAGIVMTLGITWLLFLIYVDAMISPFGTAFIYTGSTSRINYALAQVKFFPQFFEKLNSHGAPGRALIFNYLIGLLMFLPFPTWQQMVGFIVSCFVISFSIGPLALMPMRNQYPEKNVFRLPFGQLFGIVGFYICNLLIYWAGWETIWRLLIALSIGFILFFAQKRNPGKTAGWLIPYFIGLGIISYLGNFGGKNIITFGMDFGVIFVFSTLIYLAAMRSAASNLKLQPLR